MTKSDAGLPPMILLLGCTAGGKTAVSLELAARLNAEILCIDSMQVYRRMNIGTATPTTDELAQVPHHLINIAEPSESFSVARFVETADHAIADILARGKRVLALAGTPLYLMGLMYGLFEGPSADEAFRAKLRKRAETEGFPALHAELANVDPEAANRIHPNDAKRIERALEVWHLTGRPLSEQQVQWSADAMRFEAAIVGIRRDKDDNSRRINARVKEMIRDGLVDEVKSLLAEPDGLSDQARQALGYAQLITHLDGKMPLDDAIEQIKIHTRRLAKHQRTWFRKFTTTRWIDVAPDDSASTVTDRVLDILSEQDPLSC